MGLHELAKPVIARKVDEAEYGGEEGQHHEGHGHYRRALVGVITVVPLLSVEDHEHLAADVESGEEGSHRQQKIDHEVVGKGVGQDLVLAPEAGQRGHTRQCASGDDVGNESPGHVPAQAAHLAHVQFVVAAVHHTARTKEEQRLEESMAGQVEHAGYDAPQPDGGHHEAQLADGGVGQHPLDVKLRQADGRREQRGQRPDEGDHGARQRRHPVQHMGAGYHVDAGCDHRRRMDEG